MADSAGKASVLNVAFSFVLLAVNMVINVAIARMLGPEAKGVLSVFQATQSILLVIGFSAQQAVIRVVAQRRPDWPLLRRGLSLLAFLLAVFLVGLLAVVVQFPAGRHIFFAGLPLRYLWVMFFAVWGSLWFFLRSGVMDGLQQYTRFVRVGFISNVMTNVVMVSCLVSLHALRMVTAPAVIASNVLAMTGTGVVIWALVTRGTHIENGEKIPIPELLRLLMRETLPTYARDLLEWANNRVDVFFVNGMLGTGQVGLYTVAVGLANQLLQIPSAMMGPLYARVARDGEGDESLDLVQYAFRVTLALSVVTALGILVVGPLGLPLLYGDRFAGATPLLVLLLPGTILVAPTKVAITYLRGCGSLKLPIQAEIVGLILTVMLDSTLIPRFGPVGAAVASSCSYGGLSFFLCYQFMRRSKSRPADLLVLRHGDIKRVVAIVQSTIRRK